MGVIQRQGIKHSIVNLAGLVLGGVSTLWLYPLVIKEYGLMQLVLSTGIIALPLFSLGANTVAIRFFPRFQDKNSGHHGFLPLLMGLCGAGFIASGVVLLLAWKPLMSSLAPEKATALNQYIWAVIPVACLWVTSTILSVYSANFKRIVVPSLLIDFSQKIIVPILLFAVYRQWITLPQAMGGLVFHAFMVFTGMMLYLRSLGEWRWKPDWAFLTPALRKEIAQFILFGAFGGFAMLLLTKVDLFMVGSMLPIDNAGIYAIAIFLAATIEIPTRSLYSASVATVSMHISNDDQAALSDLYRRVSINLLTIGLLIFGGIWVSVDQVYELMHKTEIVSAGKWVFFFIGLSKLAEMGTGLNNYMIYYSPHYRLSLLPLGILAAGNIAFSIWLIPHYGLTGAAMATALSVTLYNTFSLGLVWQKFRLQPFSRQTIYALLIAVGSMVIARQMPLWSNWPLFNAALRTGVFAALCGGLFLYFQVSPDLNNVLRQQLLKNPLRFASKK